MAAYSKQTGEVYVVGGELENGELTRDIFAYSPSRDAWRIHENAMPQGRWGGSCVAWRDKLLVLGGINDDHDGPQRDIAFRLLGDSAPAPFLGFRWRKDDTFLDPGELQAVLVGDLLLVLNFSRSCDNINQGLCCLRLQCMDLWEMDSGWKDIRLPHRFHLQADACFFRFFDKVYLVGGSTWTPDDSTKSGFENNWTPLVIETPPETDIIKVAQEWDCDNAFPRNLSYVYCDRFDTGAALYENQGRMYMTEIPRPKRRSSEWVRQYFGRGRGWVLGRGRGRGRGQGPGHDDIFEWKDFSEDFEDSNFQDDESEPSPSYPPAVTEFASVSLTW